MIQRIVYFSRNRMRGTDDQVEENVLQILHSARARNAAVNVTGALIFNSGGFAQVLEGGVAETGEIFERIQRDDRHSDVLVLECRMVEERLFGDWSMAYAGAGHHDERMFGASSGDSGFDASHFPADEVFEAMQRLLMEEELAA